MRFRRSFRQRLVAESRELLSHAFVLVKKASPWSSLYRGTQLLCLEQLQCYYLYRGAHNDEPACT